MKQIKTLALALVATLSLAGCVKNNNAWSAFEPVRPGMLIYSMGTNQNYVALEPANVGMRVAMLVSEALSQDDKYDLSKLSEVVSATSGKNVFDALFVANTNMTVRARIETVEGIGFRVTFPEGSQMPDGIYLTGVFTVRTNGTPSLAPGGVWNVECSDVTVKSNPVSGQPQQIIHIESGSTQITSDGAGKFDIAISSLRCNFDKSSIYSDWTGRFSVKAPYAQYTYKTCGGQAFTVSGSASGPTMYTGNASIGSPLTVNYSVSDATYYGMQIVNGTQTCTLPYISEYDPAEYPSSTVTYRWVFSPATNLISYSITYNGTTVSI